MDERIYRASRNIPIKGFLEGSPVVSQISAGSVAIPVHASDGSEAVLVEGAVLPVKWNTDFFYFLFEEV